MCFLRRLIEAGKLFTIHQTKKKKTKRRKGGFIYVLSSARVRIPFVHTNAEKKSPAKQTTAFILSIRPTVVVFLTRTKRLGNATTVVSRAGTSSTLQV